MDGRQILFDAGIILLFWGFFFEPRLLFCCCCFFLLVLIPPQISNSKSMKHINIYTLLLLLFSHICFTVTNQILFFCVSVWHTNKRICHHMYSTVSPIRFFVLSSLVFLACLLYVQLFFSCLCDYRVCFLFFWLLFFASACVCNARD